MEYAQENLTARGPKNKKQIGRIGKGDKIYIEDYAVTYLNQIARAPETKNGFAGLFGTCREVEGVKEYYIYAAVYQEAENILEGGLPRDAVQKIIKQRAEMFVEYFFLGWALIIKENSGTMWECCYRSRLETLMGKPELLMTLKCNTCEEHFYLYPTEMPRETEGYFIFYEKNDAMQNFLIDWHGTNHKDKCDEEGDNVAESCRNYYKEKKAQRLRTRLTGVLMTAAALLLIFSAGIMVQGLNDYGDMQEAGSTFDEVMLSSDEEALEIVSEESLEEENNVMPEESLAAENNPVPEESIVSENNPVPEESIVAENNPVSGEILGTEENPVSEEIAETEENPVSEGRPEEGDNSAEAVEASTGEEAVMEVVSFEETISVNEGIREQYVTYEVSRGDTLYGICVQFYGDLSRAQEICRLNNIENMDNILYGEKILLPQ